MRCQINMILPFPADLHLRHIAERFACASQTLGLLIFDQQRAVTEVLRNLVPVVQMPRRWRL